jgi:hypothetical protein
VLGFCVRDNCSGMFLAGEWVPAWLWMSLAFLVAFLGVVGLGWWVLRGDARNRAAENAAEKASTGGPAHPPH